MSESDELDPSYWKKCDFPSTPPAPPPALCDKAVLGALRWELKIGPDPPSHWIVLCVVVPWEQNIFFQLWNLNSILRNINKFLIILLKMLKCCEMRTQLLYFTKHFPNDKISGIFHDASGTKKIRNFPEFRPKFLIYRTFGYQQIFHDFSIFL